MVFTRRLAYHVVVATLAFSPLYGCNSEPPPPPAEVQEAEEETGTSPPEVEMGTPEEETATE